MSEKFGKLIEQQVVIMDLKGLSLSPNSKAIGVFRECSHIDQVSWRTVVTVPSLTACPCQAYFPETLGACFLINAPWIFHPLWAIVRPWLDPHTRDKFHVLGED